MTNNCLRIGLAVSAIVMLGGCGKNDAPKPQAPQIMMANVVVPTTTPTPPPINPIDFYIQKRAALDVKDKDIADRLQRVLADLNQGLSTGDKSGALRKAAELTGPIGDDANALVKEYGAIQAPDELKDFDKVCYEGEKSVAIAIGALKEAMQTGTEADFEAGVEQLRGAAEDSITKANQSLRQSGFDPDAWNNQRKFVRAPTRVRTGL